MHDQPSHMHLFTAGKAKMTTQAALLRVVGNLCVYFLNIKEGKNRFSGIQETILLVKWPVVLPHLTTFKVKTKYFIIIVAYIYI